MNKMSTTFTSQTSCKICSHKNWKIIDTLISGIWDKSNTELVRKTLFFPIGQCQHCHHVQVTIPYTPKVFSALYFSNNLEPDMWCDTPVGNKSPYEEMVDFIADYITKGIHIVDFGAGAGKTLKHIELEYSYHSLKLSSVDFHNHIHSSTIDHVGADLNQLDTINKHFSNKPISLAISTHVLEHIIEPVNFLKNISSCLTNNGYIFIEVPDCSQDAFLDNLAVTNLVHGQHIHYYTKDSMTLLTQEAGLKIVKQQQLTTGNIPRLMLLLERSTTTESIVSQTIVNTATSAIVRRFSKYQQYQSALFDAVQQSLKNNKKVGIWGIGGDFYLLTEFYPELIDAIKSDLILLYDYELSGHTYKEKNISSSIELANSNIPIYIIPTYAPTRGRMKEISQKWGTNVIDIFEKIK